MAEPSRESGGGHTQDTDQYLDFGGASQVAASDAAAAVTHSSGDGSDHADVGTNTTHSSGSGSDHSDVALNTTHRSSDGTDHTFIGAGVCEQWQLPPLFAICARHHHDPQEVPRDDRPLSQAATIVHMGNWLAHRVLDDRRTEEPEYRWLEEIERRAPILDTAAEEVGEQLEDMEAAFGLHEEHDA